MADTSFDIIVVGGGPGGYVAAIRAAQLGMKTAVVEREHWAASASTGAASRPRRCCARPRSTDLMQARRRLRPRRSRTSRYDPKKIVERSRKVASQLSNGVKGLMKKNKITVFDGTAKLAGATAQARRGDERQEQRRRSPPRTSSWRPARARAQLPGLEADGKLVWTYKEAMVPPEIPKSLLVIGSGAIGIEFASFYRTMGAEVTVVEVLDRILPVEDEEISAFAKRAFEKQGMKILTGATVSGLKKGADNVTATITAGGKSQEITVDRVIMRRRHRRQCRESRPRRHQGEGREDPHRDRPVGLHRRAERLCHRRRRRPALARAQGDARGRAGASRRSPA